jgi:CheY-like chemotaxis protein
MLQQLGGPARVGEVRILVVEDDIASQRAIRSVLDEEGWRVRLVPAAPQVLTELAQGGWNLVIINAAMTDPRGPLFAILKDLALADSDREAEEEPVEDIETNDADRVIVERLEAPKQKIGKRLRVLFLVPSSVSKQMQPILEREGLPYALKPYNLHDFLEKVSDLLLEGGAIDAPIRTIRDLAPRKRRPMPRVRRDNPSGAMFASRDDYQMTEEEMAEWERQDEQDRKKRRKEQSDREHLG